MKIFIRILYVIFQSFLYIFFFFFFRFNILNDMKVINFNLNKHLYIKNNITFICIYKIFNYNIQIYK